MNFYKNVIEHRGKLLVRGIHDGKEYKEKIDYSPSLYAITQQQTDFQTLHGQYVKTNSHLVIYQRQETLEEIIIQITHQSLVWIDTNINIFLIHILTK